MSQAGSQRLCGREEGRGPEGSDLPGSIRASRPRLGGELLQGV